MKLLRNQQKHNKFSSFYIMFDNELTLYVNQFDNDTALIYPPQLKNEDSVTINDTSIHFAYNSIKW